MLRAHGEVMVAFSQCAAHDPRGARRRGARVILAHGITWTICLAAVAGVIVRPWRTSEATWAVAGALALVAFSLVPWRQALDGVANGVDVYLFLAGMMLLAELGRSERLFDWLAARAARFARGSPRRLFALVYGVGVVVTVFLSNDATAVVLTPAVLAAARAAKADPLPHLFVCAFVANAASFVLPIANPANFVVFGSDLPPLAAWLGRFALPSCAAIMATFVALRLTQRRALRGAVAAQVAIPHLSRGGRVSAGGLVAAAIALVLASAYGLDLGVATFAAALATLAIVLATERKSPWPIVRRVTWSILPLVAGLFVLVEGLRRTGAIDVLQATLRVGAAQSAPATAWLTGIAVALACNLLNNLPTAFLAGSTAAGVHADTRITDAILVGIDIGPNLSVTGSLATILWLAALRRDGIYVRGRDFLRIGACVMPPALVLALAAVMFA
jgi:arsenical pump membrane protein